MANLQRGESNCFHNRLNYFLEVSNGWAFNTFPGTRYVFNWHIWNVQSILTCSLANNYFMVAIKLSYVIIASRVQTARDLTIILEDSWAVSHGSDVTKMPNKIFLKETFVVGLFKGCLCVEIYLKPVLH